MLLLERGRTSIPKFVVVWTFSLWLLFFLLLFFCVCVFFLLCAISMDSSKGDKCRVACCSCLLMGEINQNKTHTRTHTHTKLQFPLFENVLSTHIQQECFFFFSPIFVSVFLRAWPRFVCFESVVVVDLICFPSMDGWLVGLFHNSTNSSVQASAVSGGGNEKRKRIKFRAGSRVFLPKLF